MTDHSGPSSQSESSHHIIHALALMLLVAVIGIFFVMTIRLNKDISETENRRLAEWPAFSLKALLDGQYTRKIETYVADHFPGRYYFTEAAFAIRAHRGIHIGERVIQIKGADTGFEDVTQWASSNEPNLNETSDSENSGNPTSELSTSEISKPEISTPEIATPEIATPEIATSEIPFSENSTPDNSKADHLSPVRHTKIAEEQSQDVESTDKPAALPNTEITAKEVTQTAEENPLALVPKSEAQSSAVPILIGPTQTLLSPPVPTPIVPTPIVPTPPRALNVEPAIKEAPKQAHAQPTATQNKPLNVVGGVLLHEGQALFMFQGTDRGAQGYANAVNTWVDLVASKRPGMTTTVVVTPTSSHFYLPPAARARTTSEAKNLAAMRNALKPEVRFADVISEMEGNQDQPLFYKSDHHWTGLGAYFAYRAWAKSAGVKPLDLSAFDKRSVPGVAGSFWSLTQAPELRNADKESYYYVPKTVTFDGTQYSGPQQKTPVPQPFFAEKSRGYIVFLGGDIPLLVSNTSAGTGRTALVVKNSYGNAFAPYLLPHFDRVVVLDYRYVSRNIQDIVDTFGVTDLVFVNATITANSGAHQERMRQVARGSSTAWLTEAEKRRIKQQEDASAKSQSTTVAGDAPQ